MLTQEQMIAKEALENFILDPETQEIILTGSPGTGKSYLLKELTNVLKDIKSINTLGFEIPYNKIVHTATTNKASLVIGGNTIHKLLSLVPEKDTRTGETALVQKGYPYYNGNIFFIDECSMINSELYSFIQKDLLNGKENKIIYVGDKNQLPPVKDENFSVFNLGLQEVELTQLLRFKSQDLKHLIEECRDYVGSPDIKDFILNIKESEHIHIVKDNEVASVLYGFGPNDRALAYTIKSVDSINSYIRKLKNLPVSLQEGDYVVCKSALPATSYRRKTYVEEVKQIAHIKQSPDQGFCEVIFTDCSGAYKTFKDPASYDVFVKALFKKCAQKKNYKEYAQFTENVLQLRYYEASTVHSAQGSTFKRVFINVNNFLNQPNSGKYGLDLITLSKLFYVAVSRAQEEVYLYYGQ